MKTPPVFLTALFLIVQSLLGLTKLSAAASDQQSISTSNYCQFLNETASADPTHLYDLKMSIAFGTSAILRSGVVGSYCYKAEDSEKNAASLPVAFLSYHEIIQYCVWKNSSSSYLPASNFPIDRLLKTNYAIASSAVTASQASGAAVAGLSAEWDAEELIGLALLFFGGGSKEFPEEENNYFLADEPRMLLHGDSDLTGRVFQISDSENAALNEAADHESTEKEHCLSLAASSARAARATYVRAAEALSPHAKNAYEQSSNHSSQRVEELAINGDTDKAKYLLSAATVARDAGKNFEWEAARTVLPHAIKAYEEALKYSLLRAEELATHGPTEKAKCLSLAAKTARDAGDSFKQTALKIIFPDAIKTYGEELEYAHAKIEELSEHGEIMQTPRLTFSMTVAMQAVEATLLHAIKAYEEEVNYQLQRAEEIAAHGETEKEQHLFLAAFVASLAGDNFKKGVTETTSPLAKNAYEKIGGFFLRRAQEIAIHGKTEKAQHLFMAAHAAYDARDAFEKAVSETILPHAKNAFEKVGKYFLERAEELAAHGETIKAQRLFDAAHVADWAGNNFESKVNETTPPQAIDAYKKADKYYFEEVEELAVSGKTEKARRLSFAADEASHAGDAFKNNDAPHAQYHLKQAEVYEQKGIEAGRAFTFEIYLQEKMGVE